MALTNVTFVDNTAPAGWGGGIRNIHGAGTAVRVKNTLIARNAMGGNCTGSLDSLGYNLSDDNSCAASKTCTVSVPAMDGCPARGSRRRSR